MLYFGDLLGAFLVNHPRWEFAIFGFFQPPLHPLMLRYLHASRECLKMVDRLVPIQVGNGKHHGHESGQYLREWAVASWMMGMHFKISHHSLWKLDGVI